MGLQQNEHSANLEAEMVAYGTHGTDAKSELNSILLPHLLFREGGIEFVEQGETFFH
jgi:hypothetical protein